MYILTYEIFCTQYRYTITYMLFWTLTMRFFYFSGLVYFDIKNYYEKCKFVSIWISVTLQKNNVIINIMFIPDLPLIILLRNCSTFYKIMDKKSYIFISLKKYWNK